MNVAQTLRRQRLRAGLTQAQLAARAGTSQAAVSAYEAAGKQPSVATLQRLLGATGARLAVEPAAPGGEPSAMQLAQTARKLAEVLSLAEALPTRHERHLRFPHLPTGGAAA